MTALLGRGLAEAQWRELLAAFRPGRDGARRAVAAEAISVYDPSREKASGGEAR